MDIDAVYFCSTQPVNVKSNIEIVRRKIVVIFRDDTFKNKL